MFIAGFNKMAIYANLTSATTSFYPGPGADRMRAARSSTCGCSTSATPPETEP